MVSTVGRNDPCPCGSGKEFKKCCGLQKALSGPRLAAPFVELPEHAAAAYLDEELNAVAYTTDDMVDESAVA